MSKRTRAIGTRTFVVWLLIVIAVALVAGIAAGVLFVLPQVKERQALEKRYQAGVAFQQIEDWVSAEGEYRQVISTDASYRDTQARLAEVRTKLAEVAATTTSVAIATAEQAQRDREATASAQTQATAGARANTRATATAQAEATATAEVLAPTATAEALDAHYQKALGYIRMGYWEEAKTELKQVFEIDPNYKEVQPRLAEVEAELAKLTPTATLTPVVPSTPTPAAIPVEKVVYSNDFEGAIGSEWSHTAKNTTPSGRGFLGELGNGTVSLTLRGLPPHEEATVSFDLFIIRSWDGNYEVDPQSGEVWGPDEWDLNVTRGPTLLHTTFSNYDTFPQAYPDAYPGGDNPSRTGADENNSLGFLFSHPTKSGPMDSVYRLSFAFRHSAPSLVLNFSASGMQQLSDESWGLDNVEVRILDKPETP